MGQPDKPKIVDMRVGLNTSVTDESHDVAFRVFQDVRTDSGGAKRRPGCVRLKRIAATGSIIDFDGVNDKVVFPYHADVWGMHLLPTWTIEGLSKASSLAAQRTLIEKGASGAAFVVYQDSTSSGRVVAEVKDSAAAVTSLVITNVAAGTLIDWRLSWDGVRLLLAVNGSSTTGTLGTGLFATDTSAVTVGSTTAGSPFIGQIERISVMSTVTTGVVGGTRPQDCRSRILNPRRPSCLFDAVFDTTDFVRDRGKYEQIGAVTGTPGTTATLLSNNPVPVQAIAGAESFAGQRKGYVVAAGGFYPVTVS